MSDAIFESYSHKRYNALTGEWVLVSPHRNKRPWQGQVEKLSLDTRPAYDPECYLCPRNTRNGGEVNPDYKDVFVFTNDFSALLPEAPKHSIDEKGLFIATVETGICKVICFSPRHDLTIPEMDVASIRKVVDVWVNEYTTLSSRADISYVQIFENKGAIMGCSNPHPHGQIWAQSTIPVEPFKKQIQQLDYYNEHRRTLLSDYLKAEIEKAERVLFEDEHFVVLIPFWAIWPFEAMIIPKRPMARITDMNPFEKDALASAYQKLTIKYDNLFETSFPYSAGIHQAPTDDMPHDEWHWHMSFYPPLLRSATVKKFMVGYEMLANPQRDITPEQAAIRLKGLSDVHYKERVR